MRHEVYEGYKAGRKKTDDALVQQLERSKDVFKAFRIPMYSSAGFEADDMLGTIVEQVKNDKTINVVIASGDMDTLQLVSGDTVRVYTLKKGIKDTIIYNEGGGAEVHRRQVGAVVLGTGLIFSQPELYFQLERYRYSTMGKSWNPTRCCVSSLSF
jgi:5'-3' exonuclease